MQERALPGGSRGDESWGSPKDKEDTLPEATCPREILRDGSYPLQGIAGKGYQEWIWLNSAELRG